MSSWPYASDEAFPKTWDMRGSLRRVPIGEVYSCQEDVDFDDGRYDERKRYDPELGRVTRSKKGVLMVPQAGVVKLADTGKIIVTLANGNHRFQQAAMQGVEDILLRMVWLKPRYECPLCRVIDPTTSHYHKALDNRINHGTYRGLYEYVALEHHGKTVKDFFGVKANG